MSKVGAVMGREGDVGIEAQCLLRHLAVVTCLAASWSCALLAAGHLVEALMSKVGAVMGREGDATPFTEVTVDNISNTLHS